MGRFGNQIFQAMFLKVYAKRHGATVETPRWVGCSLFGFDDPPISKGRPEYYEPVDRSDQPIPPKADEALDRDFVGYAQYMTSFYAPDRDYIWSILDPERAASGWLDEAQETLYERGSGKTIVGVHLRRGDYGQLAFAITPVGWYLRKLAEIWPDLTNPMLFIATEEPALVDAFREYNPVTTSDLGVKLRAEPMPGYNYLARDLETRESHQIDFFPDWYLLGQCDVLLIPNSVFSFTAAMLNPTLQTLYRSRLSLGGFEQVDPWNAYPLLRENVDDYPHLEGIKVESNPYWPGPRLRKG
jgi:hypothetical protein